MTKNILPQVSPGATVTAVLLSSHWTWNTPGSRTQTLRLKGQQEESSDLSDFHLHHQHSRGEGGETRRLLSGQLRTWVWSWNQKKTTSGWRLLETDWFFFFINTWKSLPLVWLIPGQTSRCLSRFWPGPWPTCDIQPTLNPNVFHRESASGPVFGHMTYFIPPASSRSSPTWFGPLLKQHWCCFLWVIFFNSSFSVFIH